MIELKNTYNTDEVKWMKINFVLPSLGRSGGTDVVYKYAELLEKDGHDVAIYKEIIASNMHLFKYSWKNRLHQVYCTMKALLVSMRNKNHFDRFVFILNNQFVRNADVVVATAWPTAYRVSKLPENKGKKYYFIQGFEIWDNKELGLGSYKLPLNKIVVSTWINERLKNELEMGPFPVVYSGIDTAFFENTNVTKQQDDIVRFLMLNHTLSIKGVQNGIKVYEKIHSKYPNSKLVMFGMCNGSNIPAYVEYHQNPSRDELVNLYSDSDIFIFPSIEEGWGLTPIEAMACGCAVVGTRTGFVLDFGRNKENMMISEPGDIQGMMENIENLISDDELFEKVRKGGMETVQALNWHVCVKTLEKIIGCS